MTDLKPLSAETLDRWETAARPAITVTFSADDAMSLIAQARRALELEEREIACLQHGLGFRACGKCFDILQSENAALTAALDAAEKALEKIITSDPGFETTDFELCGCDESSAWIGLCKRRRNVAREALATIRKHRGECVCAETNSRNCQIHSMKEGEK